MAGLAERLSAPTALSSLGRLGLYLPWAGLWFAVPELLHDPVWLVLIALSAPILTFELIFLHIRLRDLRPPDSPIRLVTTKPKLEREMYRDDHSVVRGASEVIVATGSRSHDTDYLSALEKRVASEHELKHLRVLVGPPQRPELRDHLQRLKSSAEAMKAHWPDDKISFVELPLGGDFTEKFICASENKVVIIIQSIHSPHGFDTGIVIDDPTLAVRFVDQLKAMADVKTRHGKTKPDVA